MLTENLWPKLFSEAPRCAPLRLTFPKANGVPSRKCLKIKGTIFPAPVGIACPEERFTSAVFSQAEGQVAPRDEFLAI